MNMTPRMEVQTHGQRTGMRTTRMMATLVGHRGTDFPLVPPGYKSSGDPGSGGMKNEVNYGTMATDGEGAPHLTSLGSRPIMVAAARARESAHTVHHHGEGAVNLANVATTGGASDAGDSNSSDSSGESADEGAVPRCDIQLDERGVAGYLLEVVDILGEHPHAFESLKELVDRHPQSLQEGCRASTPSVAPLERAGSSGGEGGKP